MKRGSLFVALCILISSVNFVPANASYVAGKSCSKQGSVASLAQGQGRLVCAFLKKKLIWQVLVLKPTSIQVNPNITIAKSHLNQSSALASEGESELSKASENFSRATNSCSSIQDAIRSTANFRTNLFNRANDTISFYNAQLSWNQSHPNFWTNAGNTTSAYNSMLDAAANLVKFDSYMQQAQSLLNTCQDYISNSGLSISSITQFSTDLINALQRAQLNANSGDTAGTDYEISQARIKYSSLQNASSSAMTLAVNCDALQYKAQKNLDSANWLY